MKRLWKATCVVAITVAVATLASAQERGETLEELEFRSPGSFADAVAAYIYGYPLLMIGVTGRIATTVATAGDRLGAAPLNQFGKEPKLPDSTFTAVVLPSTSTLYASSFLNLKDGPVILHIPEMGNRFFIMEMLDAWTNVSPESPGSRQGSRAGDYALVGPDYTGEQPVGTMRMIRMPTNTMWIIGRIFTNNTDSDNNEIFNHIYPKLTLTPLKQAKGYVPPANLPVEPMPDVVTPPVNQVAGMDACAFFSQMASMMYYNPPIPGQDDQIVKALDKLGLLGGSLDCTKVTNMPTLQLAVATARSFLNRAPTPSATTTQWTVSLGVGTYGKHYLLRAEVALHALGANNPEDAVYGVTFNDGTGKPLDGGKNYKIHFDKTGAQSIPPIDGNGFWSLTIYDALGKLVPYTNGMTYNAIGIPFVQKHSACLNSDGSLDLYLQNSPPPAGIPFCNWLQTPASGPYQAFLRMYWPDPVILNSKWIPPPILKN